MLDWIKQFSGKPDHPLRDAEAAREVLAGLPEGVSLENLEQLSHWVASVKDTPGFSCDDRLAVMRLLDDAGARNAAPLFDQFFAKIHQQDRAARNIWEALCTYWERLAEGYAQCVADFEHGEKGAKNVEHDMPLVLARSLRAASQRFKLRNLRYLGIETKAWAPLYRLYVFAELKELDTQPVVIYAREVHTTVRAELQKNLLLHLAAPHEFSPAQLELAFRILARFAMSAEWSRVPQANCNFCINLAIGGPPALMAADELPGASRRFIGGGQALEKLAELRSLCEKNMLSDELRFGKEFTPAQIITVIKHLQVCLGAAPPRTALRAHQNHGRAERGSRPEADLPARNQDRTGFRRGARRRHAPEGEDQQHNEAGRRGGRVHTGDLEAAGPSEWGLGADIPPDLGKWAEPGKLCGVQPQGEKGWWVGIVRRIDADTGLHCGIRIFSKRPVSVWLRVLGSGEHQADNWASSTGSFSFDYMRAIMLPDALKSHDHPVMILENKAYVPGQMCEVMMGEHSRLIKLVEFLEEGEDYVRAAFEWQHAGKN